MLTLQNTVKFKKLFWFGEWSVVTSLSNERRPADIYLGKKCAAGLGSNLNQQAVKELIKLILEGNSSDGS